MHYGEERAWNAHINRCLGAMIAVVGMTVAGVAMGAISKTTGSIGTPAAAAGSAEAVGAAHYAGIGATLPGATFAETLVIEGTVGMVVRPGITLCGVLVKDIMISGPSLKHLAAVPTAALGGISRTGPLLPFIVALAAADSTNAEAIAFRKKLAERDIKDFTKKLDMAVSSRRVQQLKMHGSYAGVAVLDNLTIDRAIRQPLMRAITQQINEIIRKDNESWSIFGGVDPRHVQAAVESKMGAAVWGKILADLSKGRISLMQEAAKAEKALFVAFANWAR